MYFNRFVVLQCVQWRCHAYDVGTGTAKQVIEVPRQVPKAQEWRHIWGWKLGVWKTS